jgi:hypothetical protein
MDYVAFRDYFGNDKSRTGNMNQGGRGLSDVRGSRNRCLS